MQPLSSTPFTPSPSLMFRQSMAGGNLQKDGPNVLNNPYHFALTDQLSSSLYILLFPVSTKCRCSSPFLLLVLVLPLLFLVLSLSLLFSFIIGEAGRPKYFFCLSFYRMSEEWQQKTLRSVTSGLESRRTRS